MNILILSGSDHIRFPTMINQKAYADRHGYRYSFDITPRTNRRNKYYHKLHAIRDALPQADWLFWIDDDAAFTQMQVSLESQVPELGRNDLSAIFCVSPVNPNGGWTTVSSGNFFVRNDAAGQKLIEQAIQTDLETVRAWWNTDSLGMFTNGDQDALVYHIKTDDCIGSKVSILEYERFNTRPYHFDHAGQHFLVHFTHRPNLTKEGQMMEFCSNFGLTKFLLSEQDLEPYGGYVEAQDMLLSWMK